MTLDQRIAELGTTARTLYEGERVAHRSCGIALAEAFGVGTRPYQALRKGGLTGEGPCGAIEAGRLILGELLGDPNPAGAVTPRLLEAMARYETEIDRRLGEARRATCNAITGRFPGFSSPGRRAFCTDLVASAAEALALSLAHVGHELPTARLP